MPKERVRGYMRKVPGRRRQVRVRGHMRKRSYR